MEQLVVFVVKVAETVSVYKMWKWRKTKWRKCSPCIYKS